MFNSHRRSPPKGKAGRGERFSVADPLRPLWVRRRPLPALPAGTTSHFSARARLRTPSLPRPRGFRCAISPQNTACPALSCPVPAA